MAQMMQKVTVNFEKMIEKLDSLFNWTIKPETKKRLAMAEKVGTDILMVFAPFLYIHYTEIVNYILGANADFWLIKPFAAILTALVPFFKFIGDCFSYKLGTEGTATLIYWSGYIQVTYLLWILGRVLYWVRYCYRKGKAAGKEAAQPEMNLSK